MAALRTKCKILVCIFLFWQCFSLEAKISDLRLCADPECKEPVSFGKTNLNYRSADKDVMSFPSNADVIIYSKSAGNQAQLWGGEINGKRGYFPSRFVTEWRVLKSNLTFEVPTTERQHQTGYDPPVATPPHPAASDNEVDTGYQPDNADNQAANQDNPEAQRSTNDPSNAPDTIPSKIPIPYPPVEDPSQVSTVSQPEDSPVAATVVSVPNEVAEPPAATAGDSSVASMAYGILSSVFGGSSATPDNVVAHTDDAATVAAHPEPGHSAIWFPDDARTALLSAASSRSFGLPGAESSSVDDNKQSPPSPEEYFASSAAQQLDNSQDGIRVVDGSTYQMVEGTMFPMDDDTGPLPTTTITTAFSVPSVLGATEGVPDAVVVASSSVSIRPTRTDSLSDDVNVVVTAPLVPVGEVSGSSVSPSVVAEELSPTVTSERTAVDDSKVADVRVTSVMDEEKSTDEQNAQKVDVVGEEPSTESTGILGKINSYLFPEDSGAAIDEGHQSASSVSGTDAATAETGDPQLSATERATTSEEQPARSATQAPPTRAAAEDGEGLIKPASPDYDDDDDEEDAGGEEEVDIDGEDNDEDDGDETEVELNSEEIGYHDKNILEPSVDSKTVEIARDSKANVDSSSGDSSSAVGGDNDGKQSGTVHVTHSDSVDAKSGSSSETAEDVRENLIPAKLVSNKLKEGVAPAATDFTSTDHAKSDGFVVGDSDQQNGNKQESSDHRSSPGDKPGDFKIVTGDGKGVADVNASGRRLLTIDTSDVDDRPEVTKLVDDKSAEEKTRVDEKRVTDQSADVTTKPENPEPENSEIKTETSVDTSKPDGTEKMKTESVNLVDLQNGSPEEKESASDGAAADSKVETSSLPSVPVDAKESIEVLSNYVKSSSVGSENAQSSGATPKDSPSGSVHSKIDPPSNGELKYDPYRRINAKYSSLPIIDSKDNINNRIEIKDEPSYQIDPKFDVHDKYSAKDDSYGKVNAKNDPYGKNNGLDEPYGKVNEKYDPYGKVNVKDDPYGQVNAKDDIYGKINAKDDPYGKVKGKYDPYGKVNEKYDPYGQVIVKDEPYGRVNVKDDPYGEVNAEDDPYGKVNDKNDHYGRVNDKDDILQEAKAGTTAEKADQVPTHDSIDKEGIDSSDNSSDSDINQEELTKMQAESNSLDGAPEKLSDPEDAVTEAPIVEEDQSNEGGGWFFSRASPGTENVRDEALETGSCSAPGFGGDSCAQVSAQPAVVSQEREEVGVTSEVVADTLPDETSRSWSESLDDFFQGLKGVMQYVVDLIPEPVRNFLYQLEESAVSPRVIVFTIIVGSFIFLLQIFYITVKVRCKERSLVARICSMDNKLFVAVTERDQLKQQLTSASDSTHDWEVECGEARKCIKKLQTELKVTQTDSGKLQTAVEQLHRQLEGQQYEVANLQRVSESAQSEKLQLKEELEAIQDEYEQLKEKHEKLEEAKGELERSRDDAVGDMTAQQEQLLQLNQSNQVLLKEAEVWNESVNQLESQIREYQNNIHELTESIDYKNKEMEALKEYVSHSSGRSAGADRVDGADEASSSEEDGGVDDVLKKLMDVISTKSELRAALEERTSLLAILDEERAARAAAEGIVENATQEVSKFKDEYEIAHREREEAQTRLGVLSNYFKEKELQLQKELGVQEAMRLQTQDNVTSVTHRIAVYEQEIDLLKSQVTSLKLEIDSQERSYKNQITNHEKKAHENWLAARSAERKLEETKQEATNLRNKLTLVEQEKSSLVLSQAETTKANNAYPGSNGEVPTSPHLGPSDRSDSMDLPTSGRSSLFREPFDHPSHHHHPAFLPPDRPMPPPFMHGGPPRPPMLPLHPFDPRRGHFLPPPPLPPPGMISPDHWAGMPPPPPPPLGGRRPPSPPYEHSSGGRADHQRPHSPPRRQAPFLDRRPSLSNNDDYPEPPPYGRDFRGNTPPSRFYDRPHGGAGAPPSTMSPPPLYGPPPGVRAAHPRRDVYPPPGRAEHGINPRTSSPMTSHQQNDGNRT